MAEVWATIAVVRKELIVLTRYRPNLVGLFLTPIYQFLLPHLLFGSTFAVDGVAEGLMRTAGTTDIAGFLILGALMSAMVTSTFWGAAFSLRTEMDAGTLEPCWLTPTRRDTFVVGRAIGGLVLFGISGSVLLAIATVFFGARFQASLVFALPGLLISTVAMLGVAYLITALVFEFRDPGFLTELIAFLFQGFSGLAFPVTVLPTIAQAVSWILPTTYALDLLRANGLGTRPLIDPLAEYALLIVLTLALLPIGRAVLGAAERRMLVQGTVATH